MQLEVDVPPGEDAVVLLERDGVYSWHLPREPGRAHQVPRPEAPHRAVRDPRQPRPTRANRQDTGDRRTRGLLGDLAQRAAQALVFRFVAPAILEKAIEKMEDHLRPGLAPPCRCRREEVARARDPRASSTCRPTDPSGCCCSSTGRSPPRWGRSVRWASTRTGKGFLRTAISAYDAVIGFDHKTLSLDPTAERRGPAGPPQDARSERRARHRRRHPQPRRPGDAIVRRAAAPRQRTGRPRSTTSSSSRPPTQARILPTRSGGATSSTSTPTWPRSGRADSRCCRVPLPSPRWSVGW